VIKRRQTYTAYWSVSDVDGKRVQRSKGGFRLKKEAQAHLTTTLAAIGDGTYTEIEDRNLTVAQFLRDHWMPATRTGATSTGTPRRASTIVQYDVVIEKWIIPQIGGVKLAALTPKHVEAALTVISAGGGKDGKALSGRSCQLAYTILKMALAHAVRGGYCRRNVAESVNRPGAKRNEMKYWNEQEVTTFLRSVEKDREYAAWCLFVVLGPRRGEVCGLRWSDVDLEAGTMRVIHTRVSVGGDVQESEPKTAAGKRTIPLSPDLVEVLRRHRKRQLADRLAAGPAWTDTGLVFVREDGLPARPETFSDRFATLAREAGVPVIRLHDTRHTAATIMLKNGVPVKVVSEILGHASVTITLSLYVHVVPGMGLDAVTKTSALYSLSG